MSHDTFPDAPNAVVPGSPAVQHAAAHQITATNETDAALRRKWFDDAQTNGWSFLYLPGGREENGAFLPRKMLIVAEGIEPSVMLRVLVDEAHIPRDPE